MRTSTPMVVVGSLAVMGWLGACQRDEGTAWAPGRVQGAALPGGAVPDSAHKANAAAAPTPPSRGEVIVFPGAAGFEGGRGCTDVRPEDGCDSQWTYTSGQLVRVFVVDVKEERALDAFVDRLAADVTSRGGVVDRFVQNGLTLVRFLEPVRLSSAGDAGAAASEQLASINYALVGRDRRAVHLVTSVVPFVEQEEADARLRALLGAAQWAQR